MRWLKVLGALVGVLVLLLIGVFLLARAMGPERRDFAVIAAEFEAELAAVEAKRWPRPPLFDDAAPGTAWYYYRRGMDRFDQIRNSHPGAKRTLDLLADCEDIDAQVPGRVRGLRLHSSRSLPSCGREPARTNPGGTSALATGSRTTRTSIGPSRLPRPSKRSITIQANLLAREKPRAAVDLLLVLDRFGEDFGTAEGVIHFLVGVTVRNSALSALGDLIGAGLLPMEQCDRVLDWLMDESARTPDLLEVADHETLQARRCLEQTITGEIELDDLDLDRISEEDREELKDIYYRIIDAHGGAYRIAREQERENGVAAIGWVFRDEVAQRATWMMISMELTAGTIFLGSSRMYSLAYTKLDEAPERLLAYQTAVMLTIHARRFRASEGRYPETIDEILEFAGQEFPGADLVYYRPERPGECLPAFFLREQVEEQGEEAAPPIARFREQD